MSQKMKNKSVGDLFKSVEKHINNSPDYDKKQQLVEEFEILKKQYSKFFYFTTLLLVFSIITIGFILFLSFKLEDVSFQKEKLEKELIKTEFDSLIEDLLEFKKRINEDSTESKVVEYRLDSLGNPKSYWTIVREKDSISKILLKTEPKAVQLDKLLPKYYTLSNQRTADSLKLDLLKKIIGLEFSQEIGERVISVEFKGRKIDSVRSGYLFLKNNMYLDSVEKRWLIDPNKYLPKRKQ